MKKKAVILYYHRVVPKVVEGPLNLAVSCEIFQCQMEILRRHFRVISIESLLDQLEARRLRREVQAVVSFDDGYEDNIHYAVPILEALKIPAVFFIATGAIQTERLFWWDAVVHSSAFCENPQIYDRLKFLRPQVRNLLMERFGMTTTVSRELQGRPMNWDQIRDIVRRGFSIGAHTRTHSVLSCLPKEEILSEMIDSKKILEEQLSAPVRLFSYPYGEEGTFNEASRACAVEAGFRCALVTLQDCVRPGDDPLALPRVASRNEDADSFLKRLATLLK